MCNVPFVKWGLGKGELGRERKKNGNHDGRRGKPGGLLLW